MVESDRLIVSLADIYTWENVEIGVTIIAATIPVLRVLIQRMIGVNTNRQFRQPVIPTLPSSHPNTPPLDDSMATTATGTTMVDIPSPVRAKARDEDIERGAEASNTIREEIQD
jgi:hypothetical protein